MKPMLCLVSRAAACAVAINALRADDGAVKPLTLPMDMISLDSELGSERLKQAVYNGAFFRLIRYFIPQQNLGFCGVASSVMVLNALSPSRPTDPNYGPYPFFTQDNFFTPNVLLVKSRELVSKEGMSLAQLTILLNTFPRIKAVETFASKSSLGDFQRIARENLNSPHAYILVNYLRSALGQEKGGHISPLGAYDEKTDSYLLLDVSQYKYPPVWVSSAKLWSAMSQMDADSDVSRGFVVVSTTP